LRKALADTARAQEQLALEVGKRTDAQASMQAISGLLQDGMANTMSALKHWELDKNSSVQFGSYTPLPLSAQSSSIFIQDESRYVYQQQQKSGAAQFSDVFQTPAPDGDPWSLAMSVPRMDSYNARLSSVPQMQSPAPLFQTVSIANAGGCRTPTILLLDASPIQQYTSRKVSQYNRAIHV